MKRISLDMSSALGKIVDTKMLLTTISRHWCSIALYRGFASDEIHANTLLCSSSPWTYPEEDD